MASPAAQLDPASVTDAASAGHDRSSVRLILTAVAAAVAAFGLFGAVGLDRFLKQLKQELLAAFRQEEILIIERNVKTL